MTKTIAASALGTIIAIAVLGVSLRIIGPIPLSISQTTTNKQSTFDVTGEGEVTSSPDRAVINVGVQTTEQSVQAAQDKGNQAIKNITDQVVALGIDRGDIKTTNYSLYPNYDYQQGSGQRITGYALNVNLEIKVKDFGKINQVVDTATKNGANQVGGVQFTLSDEKQRDLENQVREDAIERAKEKAESLASLSGVRLGKIVNVTENRDGGGYPLPYAKSALMEVSAADGRGGGAAAPTNIEPGSSTFRMSVTLSYETL